MDGGLGGKRFLDLFSSIVHFWSVFSESLRFSPGVFARLQWSTGDRVDPQGRRPRHDRASEQDDWDCVDVLVDEETFSQAVAS